EYLLTRRDVHVYYTTDSYANSKCGTVWLNELLTRHGTGHWTLALDADELLVYPNCERIGLKQLTSYLEQTHAEALATFMLDMYSDQSISDTIYEPGTPFLEACRYFDGDTYFRDSNNMIFRGGPRHRLFWKDGNATSKSPVLLKIPLVKWSSETKYDA